MTVRNVVRSTVAVAALIAMPASPARAGSPNVFSVEDEVKLGREASEEVERQAPILGKPKRVQRYLESLVEALSESAPGARYEYRVKVIDASEVNAFALPGGFLYVNRGVIETAETEGELAGVVAHEIAHIALRHGTQQVSRALMAQTGLEILGGVMGRRSREARGAVRTVGGVGLQALFLKYSRGAETDADVAGARMMADAGYDPYDAVRFFERLQERAGRDPNAVERFLSSHPAPSDRARRLRQEARRLEIRRVRHDESDFRRVKRELEDLPAPRGRGRS